jgi:hypothetical protein
MKVIGSIEKYTAADSTHGNAPWVCITDYDRLSGWGDSNRAAARSHYCCEQLEAGQILYFEGIPYDFPEADRDFLLDQRMGSSWLHKNISYRPKQDSIRGIATDNKEEVERLRDIMRHFSQELTRLLSRVLAPYASHWALDYASYRPEEEQNRGLTLHKRNDLLHVDAFPSRPTRGGRILRCFTNINPTRSRNWMTTDRFPELAGRFAQDAGLDAIARNGSSTLDFFNTLKRAVGMKSVNPSAYDKFMVRFHDYLKENENFQKNCNKKYIDFPPMSTWMCYTDSVPHAVLAGQYAVEQTFIIPVNAMVTPEKAPIRILEKMAGRPLVKENHAY